MAIMENHFTKQYRNKHCDRNHNNAQSSVSQYVLSKLLGLEKRTRTGEHQIIKIRSLDFHIPTLNLILAFNITTISISPDDLSSAMSLEFDPDSGTY